MLSNLTRTRNTLFRCRASREGRRPWTRRNPAQRWRTGPAFRHIRRHGRSNKFDGQADWLASANIWAKQPDAPKHGVRRSNTDLGLWTEHSPENKEINPFKILKHKYRISFYYRCVYVETVLAEIVVHLIHLGQYKSKFQKLWTFDIWSNDILHFYNAFPWRGIVMLALQILIVYWLM